jgi:hypothetical protein
MLIHLSTCSTEWRKKSCRYTDLYVIQYEEYNYLDAWSQVTQRNIEWCRYTGVHVAESEIKKDVDTLIYMQHIFKNSKV